MNILLRLLYSYIIRSLTNIYVSDIRDEDYIIEYLMKKEEIELGEEKKVKP